MAQENKEIQQLGKLSEVISAIVDEYTKMTEKKAAKNINENLNDFKSFLDPMKQIFEIIADLNVPDVDAEDYQKLDQVIAAIVDMINSISSSVFKNIDKKIAEIIRVLNKLHKLGDAKKIDAIIESIGNVERLIRTCESINFRLNNFRNFNTVGIDNLKMMIEQIRDIFEVALPLTKKAILLYMGLWMIRKALRKLAGLVSILNLLQRPERELAKIKAVIRFFTTIKTIVGVMENIIPRLIQLHMRLAECKCIAESVKVVEQLNHSMSLIQKLIGKLAALVHKAHFASYAIDILCGMTPKLEQLCQSISSMDVPDPKNLIKLTAFFEALEVLLDNLRRGDFTLNLGGLDVLGEGIGKIADIVDNLNQINDGINKRLRKLPRKLKKTAKYLVRCIFLINNYVIDYIEETYGDILTRQSETIEKIADTYEFIDNILKSIDLYADMTKQGWLNMHMIKIRMKFILKMIASVSVFAKKLAPDISIDDATQGAFDSFKQFLLSDLLVSINDLAGVQTKSAKRNVRRIKSILRACAALIDYIKTTLLEKTQNIDDLKNIIDKLFIPVHLLAEAVDKTAEILKDGTKKLLKINLFILTAFTVITTVGVLMMLIIGIAQLSIKLNKKTTKTLRDAISAINNILKEFNKLGVDPKTKVPFDIAKMRHTLCDITIILLEFMTLSAALISLGVYAKIIVVLQPILKAGPRHIKKIINLIISAVRSINEKRLTGSKKRINTILVAISSLIALAVALIAFAAVMIPLILISGPVILGAHAMRIIINCVIKIISSIKLSRLKKAAVKIYVLETLITYGLIPLIGVFVVFAAALVVFMLISIILVIGTFIMAKVINFIVKTLLKPLSNPRLYILLGLITVIVLQMTIVAVSLLILGAIASLLMKFLIPIGLFILGVIAIMILLAAIGAIASWMIPFMAMAGIAVGIVTLAVLCLLLIAAALWLIGQIKLDPERIKANAKIILDTAKTIIALAFENMAGPEDNGEEKSWFSKLLSGLGNLAGMLIGVGILILTAVAVVCLLLIAILLFFLQSIKLDTNKIMSNVELILQTSKRIISLVFEKPEDEETPSNRGVFKNLVAHICSGLAQFVSAIFSVVYLALMVIAAVLVLLIVGILKLIEGITLNPDQVLNNVDAALSTCQTIIQSIFYPDDDSNNPSPRGIFMSLLYMVCKPLAKIVEAIFTVAYLALMVIAMGLILLIVIILKEISELDPATMENAVTNAILAVQACKQIIDLIFVSDDADQTPSNRGIMMKLIALFSEDLADMLEAIFAIAYLALMMIAMCIISCIANKLYELGSMDPAQFQKAKKIAVTAVNTANEIIKLVFAKDNTEEKEKKGFIRTLLEWVLGKDVMELIDALLAVGKLAIMVMAINAIGKMANILITIAKFKFNKEQVVAGARRVTSAAAALVAFIINDASGVSASEAEDVNDYFKSFGNIVVQVQNLCWKFQNAYRSTSKATPWVDSCTNLVKHMISSVAGIEYDGITDKIDAIQVCLDKYANVVDRVISIIGRLITVPARVNPRELIDDLNNIIQDINNVDVDEQHVRNIADLIEYINTKISSITHVTAKDVRHSKQLTDNYIKFLDKVNKSDFRKLNVTERMFEHWASLAHQVRGNFEGMARAINQNMIPMLDTLNHTMVEVNECQKKIMEELSIDNNSDNLSGIPTINGGNNTSTTNINNIGGSNASTENINNNAIGISNSRTETPSARPEVTQGPNNETETPHSVQTEDVARRANETT